MAEIKESIINILTQAVSDIRQRMADENENASGRTSASLRVEDRGSSVALVIGSETERTAPAESLEVGEGPGMREPTFKSIIHQWSKDKGISFDDERERWRFSVCTARKIEREGTQRHKSPVDIYSSILDGVAEKVRQTMFSEVTQRIENQIKTK
jgi:hypothetical protein